MGKPSRKKRPRDPFRLQRVQVDRIDDTDTTWTPPPDPGLIGLIKAIRGEARGEALTFHVPSPQGW